MKVLILIDSLGIGGAETHVCTLAEELRNMGVGVIVAAANGALTERLISAKVKYIRLPSVKKAPVSCRNHVSNSKSKLATDAATKCCNIVNVLKAHLSICAIIKRYRPDIVHAHTRRMAFLSAPPCQSLKIPLITTAHAMFSMRGLRAPMSVWGDEAIAVSEDIREHILKHSKMPKINVHVIYNGIKTKANT